MTTRLIAATDGAAQPNPGPSGWAWVCGNEEGEPQHGASGYLGEATNNIGELTALAELLMAIPPEQPLEVRIDSRYAMNAVTDWLPKQRRRGYTTIEGKPIANRDLIVHIDQLLADRDVEFTWVRAHQAGGDKLNAIADHGAQEAVRHRVGHRWQYPDVPTVATGNAAASSGRASAPATKRATRSSGSSAGSCRATTKSGKSCSIEARPSGLCHVHDPAVQCGAITAKGAACVVATGGGRCERHRGQSG